MRTQDAVIMSGHYCPVILRQLEMHKKLPRFITPWFKAFFATNYSARA